MTKEKSNIPVKIIYDDMKPICRKVVTIIPDGTYIIHTLSANLFEQPDISVKGVETLEQVFHEVGGEEEFIQHCGYDIYYRIFDGILEFRNGVLQPIMFSAAKNGINDWIKSNKPELGQIVELWGMDIIFEDEMVELVVKFNTDENHSNITFSFDELHTTQFGSELSRIVELAGPDVGEISFGATDEKFEPSFEFQDAKYVWLDGRKVFIHEFYKKSYDPYWILNY